MTFGLHSPYRRLILSVPNGAKASVGWRGQQKGIGSLRYFFGNYALDTDRRELRRGVDVVPTTPQVFDLLDYLIRNRERVVSKDDLVSAIWKGRIVSDAALTTPPERHPKRDRRFRRRTTPYQNTTTKGLSFRWRGTGSESAF